MDAGRRQIEELADQVGDVLGRIDGHVGRLTRLGTNLDAVAAAVRLEAEASELKRLLDFLLVAAMGGGGPKQADLDTAVSRCVQRELQRIEFPLVLRQKLGGELPPVACAPMQLGHVVDRALALAVAHTGHGGEVVLSTVARDDAVSLELTAQGSGNAHLHDRAETLREFVDRFGGYCEASVDRDGSLHIRVTMPIAAGQEKG